MASVAVKVRSSIGVALLGGFIIAITYGLARFVFGVFLPAIREDLGFSASVAGVIGALPFASFIAAILAAPTFSGRLGPRLAAAAAAALAALGLLLIAVAPGVAALALGVTICGLSTGLASPIMADAVDGSVQPDLRGRVNASINAATSLGVALAMPAILWWAEAWRSAYLLFALIAVSGMIAVLLWLPGARRPPGRTPQHSPAPPVSREQWRDSAWLSGLAASMGFVSAVYWVLAPDFVVHVGDRPNAWTAWMWLMVGIGGLAGIAAGDLIDRCGPALTHAAALAGLAASLALLAAAPAVLPSMLLSAALFGAAYMTLTGFYLVQGVRIMKDRPALGPVMPLLAVAAGQVLGSPVAGWLTDLSGHAVAFAAFAGFGLVIAALSLRFAAVDPPA